MKNQILVFKNIRTLVIVGPSELLPDYQLTSKLDKKDEFTVFLFTFCGNLHKRITSIKFVEKYIRQIHSGGEWRYSSNYFINELTVNKLAKEKVRNFINNVNKLGKS
jgi:hypothetical protein